MHGHKSYRKWPHISHFSRGSSNADLSPDAPDHYRPPMTFEIFSQQKKRQVYFNEPPCYAHWYADGCNCGMPHGWQPPTIIIQPPKPTHSGPEYPVGVHIQQLPSPVAYQYRGISRQCALCRCGHKIFRRWMGDSPHDRYAPCPGVCRVQPPYALTSVYGPVGHAWVPLGKRSWFECTMCNVLEEGRRVSRSGDNAPR